MKQILSELSPLSIKQSRITDGDKVRYRVYRTKDDYVAVIAENALMAMKVSEVKEPYKIVRDLPTHELTIGEERMQRAPAEAEPRMNLSIETKPTVRAVVQVEIAQKTETAQSLFQTLGWKDMGATHAPKPLVKAPVAPATPVSNHADSAEAAAPQTIEQPVAAQVATPPIAPELPEEKMDLREGTVLSPADVAKLLGE